MNKFASLCILSYKRPERLQECLDTLLATIDYPCEIIINCDGGDTAARLASDYFHLGKASKLILSIGDNRGVGRSFQNCLGVAEGDYIFKIDSDIIFKPQWLSKAVSVLENNLDVGTVGLFDYHRQDPNDDRFKPENNVAERRVDCLIVKDYVSSIYGFRKDLLDNWLGDIPDDGLHSTVGGRERYMALLDVVDNKAFGFGSVYVTLKPDGTAFKTQTFDSPLLFEKNS